ncbi:retrovirus-related pol polyprotein from transposon TNT 1-94 [Tanacetum coccineum]
MCKTAKDVWNSLIITHQGNKQVKDNKIDLFVQKYEEFVISDDETIDCAFVRFNTIITSLKALDESFSSRNHVRKFLRALPTKWRPKVTAIEEFKDLLTLHLDELISNLKVYEVVLEKDSEASKVKKEKYKSLALKAMKVSSDKEESCSRSDERCWSESDEEDESKRDEIYLMALDNNEVLSDTPYYSSSSLDSESLQNKYNKLCKISLRIINKNKHLKAKNELLKNKACDLRKRLEQLEKNKEICVEWESCVGLQSKVNSLSLKLASFESSSYFLQEMIENQRSLKDKHGLGFTEGIASTSNTKMKKLCHVDEKTSNVEPALPVPSFDNEVQFGAFWDANAITHNFSAPRTPQSNGVVERKNQTLQEMSRTMLNEQSIPKKFWCNAVDTSTNILNVILIRLFLRKTPYELFKGKKPSLEYFKVFGSKCFIFNTKDYLTKFDPKSSECVFLGYSPNSKAYIILNKETTRVKESLNVRFDESPPPKSSPLVDDDIIESQIIENQIEDIEVKENEPLNKEIVNIKESKDHPIEKVIGNLNERTLRSQVQNQSNLLVPPPDSQTIIGTKWVFKNKLDENGVVSRNKVRLVAQGYNQQERIDFDETYVPIARLESLIILLAYACAHDFKLIQMDVKSAFLNGFINEEVYVAQPPGFVDSEKPNRVFKLKKAIYGLKQAPKLGTIDSRPFSLTISTPWAW